MKKIQRWLFVILCIAAACALWLNMPSVRADEEERPTSGTCGENLTWTYENGTVTISGYGPMYDYPSELSIPWYYWLDNGMVDTMVIGSGITGFSLGAFFNYGGGIDQVYYEGTLAQWCAIDFPDRFANPTSDTENMYIDGQRLEGELVIPEGVTSIGDYAFVCCYDITGITLPEGLEQIGEEAFWWCWSVTSVNLPEGLVSIGKYAFERVRMDSITIPESLTEIGDHAFYDCDRLRQVTIPDWVTSIGDSAFAGCDVLTQIHIPEGITQISDSAFSGCYNLTEINIPESVTRIGKYAFSGCASLTQLHIPEGVTEIGAGAFSGCCSLAAIDLPEGLTVINEGVFSGCGSLTGIVIPEGVTGIGDYAFSGCQRLKAIKIPEGVTSIGEYAFCGCRSLSNLVLGNRIASIGDRAFDDCFSLSHIQFYGSREEWFSTVIMDGNLELAELHYGQTEMDSCAACQDMQSIEHDWSRVSDGLIYCTICSEQGNAVEKCGSGLTWSLEDGVLTISGSGEMYDFDETDAPWQEFSKCFHTVVIEGGVTNVGEEAFKGYANLTDVIINANVTILERNAFAGCSRLRHISLPNTLKTIYFSAFRDCVSLTSVTIPSSVTLIRESAFAYCISLKEVIIPDSVTQIEGAAFYGCYELTNVVIGKNVKQIGRVVFGQCATLEHILFDGSQEQWEGLEIDPENKVLQNTVTHFTHSSADTCEYCKNAAIHVHSIRITQSDEAGHAYQCQDCGYESGLEDHSLKWDWNNEEHWQACECGWEVSREAHDLTDGKCDVCCGGSDPLPTYTAPSEGTPTEPGDKADPENSLLWVILGIGLVVGLAALFLRKKKTTK